MPWLAGIFGIKHLKRRTIHHQKRIGPSRKQASEGQKQGEDNTTDKRQDGTTPGSSDRMAPLITAAPGKLKESGPG